MLTGTKEVIGLLSHQERAHSPRMLIGAFILIYVSLRENVMTKHNLIS